MNLLIPKCASSPKPFRVEDKLVGAESTKLSMSDCDTLTGSDVLKAKKRPYTMCVCVYVHMYMYVCVCVHMYVLCIYVCMHVCMYVHIYVCIYVCVCVCVCLCVYVSENIIIIILNYTKYSIIQSRKAENIWTYQKLQLLWQYKLQNTRPADPLLAWYSCITNLYKLFQSHWIYF